MDLAASLAPTCTPTVSHFADERLSQLLISSELSRSLPEPLLAALVGADLDSIAVTVGAIFPFQDMRRVFPEDSRKPDFTRTSQGIVHPNALSIRLLF